MNIVLASASRQRKNILSTVVAHFEIIPADIDEKAITGRDFAQRAIHIATAKAEKVAQKVSDSIIIAADSFIVLNNKILEKPQDKNEARVMLSSQSGKWVEEFTGCCLINQLSKEVVRHVVNPKGKFRSLSRNEIEKYISQNPVTEWAAGYSPAYDQGAALFSEIHGSFTGFTHGLPMEVVIKVLKDFGLNI